MCSKLTAYGEKVERRVKEREREEAVGERQAIGISFYGNHHFAHGNKLPAMLKHREMGGVVVVVVVVVVRCGFGTKNTEEKHHINTFGAHFTV